MYAKRKRECRQAAEAAENGSLQRWPGIGPGSVAVTWLVLCSVGLLGSRLDGSPPASLTGYEVVKEYPHDAKAFCQGLEFVDGVLYEGTGQYGESTLREVDLESGRPLRQVSLDRRLFGEGITVWKDRIIQLTWRSGIGIVYDRESLTERSRFRYKGQGWGLTHDDRHLIMSDGTARLQFLDPETFHVVRVLTVRSKRQEVHRLNELEYVKGEIFANVFEKDYVVRISPKTGEVTGWIDFRGLLPPKQRSNVEEIFNGIAYDAEHDRLFVTGKNWPKLFEVRLVPKR